MSDSQTQDAYIFLGQIGTGKSIQAKILSSKLDGEHISTGSLIRKHLPQDERMKNGELLPDSKINQIIKDAITNIGGSRPIVFDGYPRTVRQKEWLDEFLQEQHYKVAKVLVLEVEEDEIFARLHSRNRGDDTDDAIKKRMEAFHHQAEKVIKAFDAEGLVVRIDGNTDIEGVAERIANVL